MANRLRWALVLLLVLIVLPEQGARAAFRGGNGLIVFAHPKNGVDHLYAIRADGTGLRQITKGESQDDFPAWSPNGRRIAFTRTDPSTGTGSIYVVRADGSHPQQITPFYVDASEPTWAPSGKRMAFTCSTPGGGFGSSICVIDGDGSGLQTLTGFGSQDIRPAWSPNGRMIAYTHADGGQTFQIWVMDPNGGNQRRVTHTKYDEFSFDWSPDSKMILMTCANPGKDSKADVFTIRPNGKGLHQLTGALKDSAAAWSPDGNSIVLVRSGYLYVMSAGGAHSQRMGKAGAHVFEPDWQRRPRG